VPLRSCAAQLSAQRLSEDRSKPSAVSNPSAYLVRAASELNSRYRVALRSVGAIALKPAFKIPGLHGVCIRGKVAHSNVCKSTPACAGSMLASIIAALHLGQAGR
jgi:hypothetical protein